MRRLVEGMPKVELHMHLEGSLEPELLFALARRNGIDIGFASEAALRAAYDFANLQSFLDIYYAGLRVLLDARDFDDMTWSYLRRVRQDNVVHAEVFLAPQAHLRRGIDARTMFDGVLAAMARAQAELGMTTGLILVFQRQFSEAEAFDALPLDAGDAIALQRNPRLRACRLPARLGEVEPRHRQRGVIEPDEMDYRRNLEICMPYLGPVVGVYTDWNPLVGRETLFKEDVDHSDPWQFKNVRVR